MLSKRIITMLLSIGIAAIPVHASAITEFTSDIPDPHPLGTSWVVTDFSTYVAELEQPEEPPLTDEEKALCEEACKAEVCSCETPVEDMGYFTAHAYCDCAYCCGEAHQPTCTGTVPVEGRTIAVDPELIPLGSKIALEYEDGSIQEFIAEDTGSGIKGRMLDVYFADHERAWDFGSKNVRVYIEREVE